MKLPMGFTLYSGLIADPYQRTRLVKTDSTE